MKPTSLRDLVPIDRVWSRMTRVEDRLLEVTTASDDFLTEIAQHLIKAGGKRYRPLLTQVAAELGPAVHDGPVEAGVSVELVHIGSLYHDDVIDQANTRRGMASVNAKWDDTAAILGGDYLLAKASEVAAPLGREAVALIASTYAQLCEGQVLELQLAGNLDHGPDEYFRVIGGKTGSLIRTASRLGAITAGADAPIIDAMSEWAWEVGLVFQMVDDVLDLVAEECVIGKPAGSDIGEGTYTLPVLYAATGHNGAEVRRLLADGPPADKATIARVIELSVRGGHVERVIEESKQRLAAAEEASVSAVIGPLNAALRQLEQYLMIRLENALARPASRTSPTE